MVVFLHRLVAVSNSSVSDSVYMVSIVEAVVAEIVTSSCQNNRENIDLIQLRVLNNISFHHHQEAHLHHVRRV